MIRTITLKHAGNCAKCGTPLQAGRRARWTPGKVFCLSNDHRGNLTRGEYRARINIAEGSINFAFGTGRITLEERDAQLAKLRG
jgi:hypothetical protein